MSHSHPAGLLAAYNSLMDKHLAGYFNNTRIRRHLLRSGLITRSGRILSEKEYKLNIMKQDHQKYIRECLAQAIFHKVLDMERYHQLEIKKKLETLARKERIQRFKGEHTRRFIVKNMPVLSPRPPVSPKNNHGHGIAGHSSPSVLTVPRPYTAPGNMQPPIRLQPLSSNPAVGTVLKITSGSRSKTSLLENEAPFPTGGKKAVMKFRSSMDKSQGTNPYLLPNINNYLMPSPPPLPPTGTITRENRVESWRRRRFRPITAPNGLEPLFTRDSRRIRKTSLHSNAAITMIYLGKSVHLSHDDSDFRDEIKVYQQHCGGENLCVYKGKLLEKETFQFISKRHHGFPFSLTFFLNGIQVNRLSSCCEYKHRKGSRLGGKRGYFGFVCVEKSSPCYKCIIAMGLDKKTSLPKTRKERNTEQREDLKKGEEKLRKDKEYMVRRRNEIEWNQGLASAIFSVPREKNGIREVRTAIEEMQHKGKPGEDISEDDQEITFNYEYEEDFEVDEEKQYENTNGEGQADDQMNGMSKSPSDDERDHLDPEKESETSSQKAPDADDNVKDEGDGCSDGELEDDKQDRKTASSTSSRSHPYSSCSEDEFRVGDENTHTENRPDKSARSSLSTELSENDEPGKSHFPTVESLKVETGDQKIIMADVKTKLMLIEEDLENDLEEDVKRTQAIGESISDNSSECASKEEKEKGKTKLWEGRTAKAKGRNTGLSRVEREGAGQITAGALEPGYDCHCDANPGVSSTDNRGKQLKKPEIDSGRAMNVTLVVEERIALNSNKEAQQVAPEMHMLEKKDAVKEDEVPQPREADPMGEKGGAALWGDAGIGEVPPGEWKLTAVQPAFIEKLFSEEKEVPQDILSKAGEAAEGDGRVGKVELNPMGQEAGRHAAGLNDDGAPEQQASMQTVFETEKADSEGDQDWEKVELARKAAALNSEPVPGAVALGEAAMPEKEKAEREVPMSEARSEEPDVKDSEEETSTDLKDLGPVDEAASKGQDSSEVAIVGEEKPAEEGEEVMETETPLRASTSEKAEVTQVGVSEGSTEELYKEDAEREESVTESNREDDREEMLSEELDMARDRKKAERPNKPLRETESEREEVTRANSFKDEDALEEENKFKEERETMKEVGSEEETKALTKETGSDAEDEAPSEASEWTEGGGQQRDDSLKGRGVTMFEAAPGFEKSLENLTALRKQGAEEGLVEARGRGNKGRAEHLLSENMAPTEKDEGPLHALTGVLGAPQSKLSGKAQAPEVTIMATGEAEGRAGEDKDCLAGLRWRDKEGPLQGPEGVGVVTISQEDVPEGDPMMAEMFSQEAMTEGAEEEEEEKEMLSVKNGNTEGKGSVREVVVTAEEDTHRGGEGGMAETTTEKRAMLAELKTDEGETVENKASSSSHVAGEETWHNVDELLEKSAATEGVAGEETALSREAVTVASTPEAGLGAQQEPSYREGEAPEVARDCDQERGAVEVTQGAGSVGEESGATEAFRLRLSPENQLGLSRGSLPAVQTLPMKPDVTETQEKQVQRESEKADVSVNTKA